jgi:hypothetical protein
VEGLHGDSLATKVIGVAMKFNISTHNDQMLSIPLHRHYCRSRVAEELCNDHAAVETTVIIGASEAD